MIWIILLVCGIICVLRLIYLVLKYFCVIVWALWVCVRGESQGGFEDEGLQISQVKRSVE